jgi:hypothetical protein
MAAIGSKAAGAVSRSSCSMGRSAPYPAVRQRQRCGRSIPTYFLPASRPSWLAVVLSSQQSVVARAGTASRSILEAHPQDIQLFCIRIPAFGCLCSGFDGRLNGLGTFIFNSFDQSEFARSIYLRPPESGDEFGMGNGLIHKDLII